MSFMPEYTFVGFLISCIIGLSIFVRYLVAKVIKITERNAEAFVSLTSALNNNTLAIKENTEVVRELQLIINKQ